MGKDENKIHGIAELDDSKKTLYETFGRISDAYILLDLNSNFLFANQQTCKIFKTSEDQLIGKNIWTLFPDLKETPFYLMFQEAMLTKEFKSLSRYSDFFSFWYECYFYPSTNGISIFVRDISKNKKAELSSPFINRLYLFVSKINQLIIKTTDQNTFFENFCKIAIDFGKFQMVWIGKVDEISNDVIPIAFAGDEHGYLRKIKITLAESKPEGNGPTAKAIRDGNYIVNNDFESNPIVAPWKADALANNFKSSFSIPIKRFDSIYGAVMFYSSQKNYFDEEEIKLLLELTENIAFKLENIETEKLRIETELKLLDSEKNFREIVETTNEGILVINSIGITIFANKRMAEMTGFEIDELYGKTIFELMLEEETSKIQQKINERKKGISDKYEAKLKQKNGSFIWCMINASPIIRNGIYEGSLAMMQDITHAKESEEKIRYTNRLYLFISHFSQLMLKAKNQKTLFKDSCRIAVEIGGFKMAWIGMVDEISKKIVPVVHAGEDQGYFEVIKNLSAKAEEQEGQGPTGKAIREGHFVYINDVNIGFKVPQWRTEATQRGFLSVMAIPLIKAGKVIGALTVYSPVKNFFNESERELIRKVTNSISFALDVFERERIRKIVEKNLFVSQKRYSVLTEMSPVAVFHTDIHGNPTYVNPRWSEITGIPMSDVSLESWRQIIHPDDKEMIFKKRMESIRLQTPFIEEFRFLRKDKSIIHVITHVIAERDTENKIIGYIGTTTDISEIKKKKKELLDYRFAFDQSSIVDVSDKNGNILYANENFCKISGYSLDELINQNHRILSSGYHTKDYYSNLWNTIYKGNVWHNEIRNKSKDGSFYWTDTTIVPFLDENKKPFQFISIRSNITNRKEAEKRYIDLFNLSPLPMWLYDLKTTKIIQANQATITNYGYSQEELLTMTIFDIRPEFEIENLQKCINERKLKKTENFSWKSFIRKKNDEVIEIEMYGTFIDLNGVKTGSVIAIDVTEKNRLENQINKAILKTQEDERYEMGGELHDNISQLLVASQLSLGMLKKSIASDKLPMYFQSRKYMELALIEIRNLSHRLAPVFFEDKTLEDAFRLLSNSMNTENNFKVIISFDDTVKTYPFSHELQLTLYRILQEQLKNILKYSKATIVEIDLTIYYNLLSLRIADNGIGFDMKNIKPGIGLANIKRRAELFSGESQIISSEGNGCIVLVDIPLKL